MLQTVPGAGNKITLRMVEILSKKYDAIPEATSRMSIIFHIGQFICKKANCCLIQ